MKFGAAVKVLLACAWFGTSEASNSTIVTPLVRSRRTQEGAAPAEAAPAEAAPANPMASAVGAAMGAGMGMAAGMATKIPVKKLKYHIGGGKYDGINVVNNVGYAFLGYDVVKGNPLDTSGVVKVDEGFRNAIFESTDYQLLVDREYYAPANLNVIECEGCNMHATTKVLDTMSDYVGSLNTKVGMDLKFNAKVASGAFSASFDYKQAKEKMVKEHGSSTQSEISCCVYQAELQAYNMPPHSKNFLEAVARLKEAAAQDSKDKEKTRLLSKSEGSEDVLKKKERLPEGALKDEIVRFVKSFGTHYVRKVTMGSLYGEQTFISQTDKRDMEEKGYNIAVAAAVSVMAGAFDAGMNFEMDKNRKQTEEFSSKTSKKSIYSRGSKPPTDGDMQEWLAYSSDNPVPTYIEIAPIAELDAYKNEVVQNAIRTYTETYCYEVSGAECDLEAGSAGIKSVEEKEAAISDFKGRHQPGIKATETNAFLKNTQYETKSTWIFTGLEGTYSKTNAIRHYKAVVSTLGEDNAMYAHQTGDVGWTGWSNYDKADLVCADNTALVGIQSHIGHRGDRKFGLNCAKIPGMEISKESLDPKDGLSMISAKDSTKLSFVHEYKESFKYECPLNHVMVGFHSTNSFDQKDLHWKIKCALMTKGERQVDSVSVTPTWNKYQENFYYSAPPQAVLKGLIGDFSPEKKDARYRFAELWLAPDATTLGSVWSSDWEFNAGDPEAQEFSCGGQALVGMKSIYNKDSTGPARNFKFECRSVGNHRLQHADGRTARNGSEYNEKDWTGGWAGKGASFGLECSKGKVLAGVKTRYDVNQKDFAWKALCLFIVHN